MSASIQELFNISDQLAKNLEIPHKLAVTFKSNFPDKNWYNTNSLDVNFNSSLAEPTLESLAIWKKVPWRKGLSESISDFKIVCSNSDIILCVCLMC